MTNQELQSIIEIGDMCKIRYADKTFRFLGYDPCKWQTHYVKKFHTCQVCKGRMIFEDETGKISTSCHSQTGKEGINKSDVEIIQKGNMLPEELFEL